MPRTDPKRGREKRARQKKKSVKADVTSKFNAKRKLSRMGKVVQKGTMAASVEFMSRSSALKKLQISLKDFRRLCILKGVYPRVPDKAPKSGRDKIYYDIKDISAIAHERLLPKFREFKVFMKKVRKAANRKDLDSARRIHSMKPTMPVDHLVKERYPRFIDALKDMDDALCMVHLFASLQSLGRVNAERTAACKELVRQWQYYVVRSHSLRKVFVSVKGVYFQIECMGEPITWVTPHRFTQMFPKEVDFRVMLTFLEFYETFLQFVMYKLYNMIGLSYPPSTDPTLDKLGCNLLAISSAVAGGDQSASVPPSSSVAGSASKVMDPAARAAQRSSMARLATLDDKLDEMAQEDEENDEDADDDGDEEEAPIGAPLAAALNSLKDSDDGLGREERSVFATHDTGDSTQLFRGLRLFLNREVPLEWLQLCGTAFGAEVGWDGPGSPFGVDDAAVTHQVVDRPMPKDKLQADREYIMPQWVFDSINAAMLLPVRRYMPGVPLPPHLSPFVDDDEEGYVPKYREELRTLSAAVGGGGAEEEDEVPSSAKKVEVLESDEEEEDEDEGKSDVGGEEEEEEEEDEKPLGKRGAKKGPKAVPFKPTGKEQSEGEEMHELQRNAMGRKTKFLYDRMQHGIKRRRDEVETLKAKRAKSEAAEEQQEQEEAALPEVRKLFYKKPGPKPRTKQEAAPAPASVKAKASAKSTAKAKAKAKTEATPVVEGTRRSTRARK